VGHRIAVLTRTASNSSARRCSSNKVAVEILFRGPFLGSPPMKNLLPVLVRWVATRWQLGSRRFLVEGPKRPGPLIHYTSGAYEGAITAACGPEI